MASYTKAAAPRQLVTIGTEGFFGKDPYGDLPSYVLFNPGIDDIPRLVFMHSRTLNSTLNSILNSILNSVNRR